MQKPLERDRGNNVETNESRERKGDRHSDKVNIDTASS